MTDRIKGEYIINENCCIEHTVTVYIPGCPSFVFERPYKSRHGAQGAVKRIAELEKQVPKVRLKAIIRDANPIMCRVYLEGECMPLGQPFSSKPFAAQWCADRGFEVVP